MTNPVRDMRMDRYARQLDSDSFNLQQICGDGLTPDMALRLYQARRRIDEMLKEHAPGSLGELARNTLKEPA